MFDLSNIIVLGVKWVTKKDRSFTDKHVVWERREKEKEKGEGGAEAEEEDDAEEDEEGAEVARAAHVPSKLKSDELALYTFSQVNGLYTLLQIIRTETSLYLFCRLM